MSKIKRCLLLAFSLMLFISSLNTVVVAAASTKTVEKTFIVIGSYSIWLHSDGKTWQNGIGEGSHIDYTASIKYPDSATDRVKSLKSVAFFKGETEADEELWNKVRKEDYWEVWLATDGYKDASVRAATYTFDYLGNGEANLNISTDLVANTAPVDIKEEWQSEMVEGLRYYLPRVEVWEVEEETEVDDNYRFDFSVFSKWEVNQSIPVSEKFHFVFWMADFKGSGIPAGKTEEFYLDIFHHGPEGDWKETRKKETILTLTKDKPFDWEPFDWEPFEVLGTPIYYVIYRKGTDIILK